MAIASNGHSYGHSKYMAMVSMAMVSMARVSMAHPCRVVLEVREGGPVLAEDLLRGRGHVRSVAGAACAGDHCDLEVEIRHHLAHTPAEGARLLRARREAQGWGEAQG